MSLTRDETRALRAVADTSSSGRCSTIRDVADHMKRIRFTVYGYVGSLERQGLVSRKPRQERGWCFLLTHEGRRILDHPSSKVHLA